MPVFSYIVVGADGRERTGREEAISESALEGRFRKQNAWVVELKEQKSALGANGQRATRGVGKAVPTRTLTEFFLQLSMQLRAGIPLLTALSSESLTSGSARLFLVQQDLVERVQSGQSMSEALDAHPRVFGKLIINVIRSGEASGKLAESCQQVRGYLEWQERMASDVKQALTYPCFILACCVVFALLVFTFVIPKFSTLLTELNVPLPGITVFVMTCSQFMLKYWPFLTAGIVGGFFLFKVASRTSPAFAYRIDLLKMKTPVIGKLYHMIGLSRFARNLSSIYQAGVPLLDALSLVREVVENRVLEKGIGELRSAVTEGRQMHVVMGDHPVFSKLVAQMVAVGETTGSLGLALDNVASYYDEILPRQIKKMFGLLEPLLILGLVGFVGFIALAVFLPIVSLITVR